MTDHPGTDDIGIVYLADGSPASTAESSETADAHPDTSATDLSAPLQQASLGAGSPGASAIDALSSQGSEGQPGRNWNHWMPWNWIGYEW